MSNEQETYNITLRWNNDHFDAYVKELGEGVKATGKTREEALRNADKAIARVVYEADQQKEQKTA